MPDFLLHHGDCLDVLATLEPESIDAVVTDPPYGIGFMGHQWDQPGEFGPVRKNGRANGGQWNRPGRTGPADRGSVVAGTYDFSVTANRRFQEWCSAWAAACLRVLKPGGHLVSFGGPRTYHRLTAGFEDAGFEIRDCLMWLYGSGFPKSRNLDGDHEGWGTALKPAYEPIVLSRKPLAGTVAQNVQQHGTGALNVDGCRIPSGDDHRAKCESVVGLDSNRNGNAYGEWKGARESSWSEGGRWPANVVLDEAAAAQLDAQTGVLHGAGHARDAIRAAQGAGIFGIAGGDGHRFGDTGGASRFLYVAKASKADRGVQNTHPTVKPVELMRWLVRLVTPPGGTVLDPFAGSGTTGIAALIEGFRPVLIEREAEYLQIIEARLSRPIEPVLFGGAAADFADYECTVCGRVGRCGFDEANHPLYCVGHPALTPSNPTRARRPQTHGNASTSTAE